MDASAGDPDQDYDDSDFAAALASFDREQAAENAAAQNLTAEEVIVTGTVVKITDKHVVVDIGLKSEGLIPLDQVARPQRHAQVQPSATPSKSSSSAKRPRRRLPRLATRRRCATRSGTSSKRPPTPRLPSRAWSSRRVKGGLTVDIGIKAFLPGSQVEVRPVRNLDGYIGTEIEVRVIKLNKKRGNVVISRKELLEEEQNAKKAVTLSTLEEGSVLTGIVKNLTDYGAFVDMGGLDGLLHITDMSWGRLTHPRDLVNVGDEIQVKVLKFDKDKQRVSLGFKQLTPDPWLDATERYPIGAQVRGRVLSVTDYGAFVELEQGIEGLVHVSEMTWSKRMKHPSKMVKPGDEVDTIILSVNPNDRRISLGMKQLQDNPWEQLEDKYPTGAIIEGRVRNLTDFGAFIEIEDGIDGLVHVSNLQLDQAHQASFRSAQEGREGQGHRARRRARKPPPLARRQAASARCLGYLLRAAPRRRRHQGQGPAHRAVRRLRRDRRRCRRPLPRLRSGRRARQAGRARTSATSTSSRSSR